METGQLIKELRLKKGITQEELAFKTDLSVRTIQRIESGEVDPRAYTLQSIANALEVDYERLLDSEFVNAEPQQGKSSKWLSLVHLSGLLILIAPPIIIWILKRDEVKEIRKHAVDVINYQLSISLYAIPLTLFGIYPLLILLFLYSQFVIILNTVKVTSNQPYKYPLSINFLKHNRQKKFSMS